MTTPPPFDPELAVALGARPELVVTSLAPADIPALRRQAVEPDRDAVTRGGWFAATTHAAPGALGAPDVPVLMLRPATVRTPVPCLVHLHGGGLITGGRYDDVGPVAELAAAVGCAVASIEYRLAPEHPYPAAVDDAFAALSWLAADAVRLGIDPDRVVLHGISAGGGLAAATALLARDRGGPPVLGQLLVCPMLDDRDGSPSARQMAGRGAWDRTANATAWGAYLGDVAGGPGVPAYAAPARATDLSGLPPAFLDVGSAETFRDEVVRYADRLWSAGGDAELHVWPGGFHGFDHFAPEAAVSRDARHARRQWLARLLGRAPGSRPGAEPVGEAAGRVARAG
ncbi:alpha/beta hydrolase [uncultured Cellulomonas sp.]|uniref:alpha/beta hydrolase n=1 Tax=uncultured Cellulomonas sp. TaxID=189682 RepID=UPI002618C28E|nr:alpha/beta hydrolase [uncultured Cellulomonas sp.]